MFLFSIKKYIDLLFIKYKKRKKNYQGLILDFYQAQNKYRQKQFRSILNYILNFNDYYAFYWMVAW